MTPSNWAELGLTVIISGGPRNWLTAAAVQVVLTLMTQTRYSHTSALNKCVTVRSRAHIPSKRRLYVSLNNSNTTFPTRVIIAGDERASSLFHLSPLPCLSFPPSHLSSGTVLQQQPAMLCWFLAGRWGSPGKLGLTAGSRDTVDTRANREKLPVNVSRVATSTLEKYNIYMQTMLSVLLENVLCSSLFYNSFDAFSPQSYKVRKLITLSWKTGMLQSSVHFVV